MGKRKAGEAGLFIPGNTTPEQSGCGTGSKATAECGSRPERATDQELAAIDIGSGEHPLPEVIRIGNTTRNRGPNQHKINCFLLVSTNLRKQRQNRAIMPLKSTE